MKAWRIVVLPALMAAWVLFPCAGRAGEWIGQGKESVSSGGGVFFPNFDTGLRVDEGNPGEGRDIHLEGPHPDGLALQCRGRQEEAEKNGHPGGEGTEGKGPGHSESLLGTAWHIVKGWKSRDALLLGMWSLHLDGSGEFFGDGDNNDENWLLGLQYYGISGGTFLNSHDDRAWFLGLSRTCYTTDLSRSSRMDIGYDIGLLYGYGDDLSNVGGVSMYIVPKISFTYKRFGLDLDIVPVGVISANFRIDIDGLFRKPDGRP